MSLGKKNQEIVAIFGYKDTRGAPWDPDSINSGIFGSEEAVIYLSQKLASLCYKVFVFANPPEQSRHSHLDANPRFLQSDSQIRVRLDIAIAWRQPWKAIELRKQAKKVYLWPHDTSQGSLGIEEINAFDDVFWLSDWQRRNWISQNSGFARFTNIIGNGINPDQFQTLKQRKNPYACIYCSNYARGLEILLDIWPRIKQKFPLATLDIYYGWQHWGLLSMEKKGLMRSRLASLASFGVREHGLVSHEEVNQAYARASLWTYPCILPETFCIAALRAQFAGAIPVIIEGSALRETVRYGFKCARSKDYFGTLTKAMRAVDNISVQDRKKMRDFIKGQFTWGGVANRVKRIFESEEELKMI